jgi:hypothetical protein
MNTVSIERIDLNRQTASAMETVFFTQVLLIVCLGKRCRPIYIKKQAQVDKNWSSQRLATRRQRHAHYADSRRSAQKKGAYRS